MGSWDGVHYPASTHLKILAYLSNTEGEHNPGTAHSGKTLELSTQLLDLSLQGWLGQRYHHTSAGELALYGCASTFYLMCDELAGSHAKKH